MRYQDEEDPTAPVGNGAVENAVAKPGPEERLAGNFKPAVPPSRTSLGSLVAEKVAKTQDIEVKPAKKQNRIVQVILESQQEIRCRVKVHYALIVSAPKIREEAMRDGEEWHVFDIRVVFRRIGDNVMDIMVPLPPSQAQSSQVIRNYHANHTVYMEMMSDTHVACVMGCEDKLMPEAAEEEA